MEMQNLRLEIYCDELAENPREWDNVGTMVCWHHRYAFGDKHDYADPQDFLQSDDAQNAYAILPVYLYDHSIQKLSTSSFVGRAHHADWDSGQVGYIYINEKDVKKLTGFEATEENKPVIENILICELDTYSAYIEGDSYGFRIIDRDGDLLDSCGGFYGSNMSKVLETMKGQESYIERQPTIEILQH